MFRRFDRQRRRTKKVRVAEGNQRQTDHAENHHGESKERTPTQMPTAQRRIRAVSIFRRTGQRTVRNVLFTRILRDLRSLACSSGGLKRRARGACRPRPLLTL